jgi:hypothetical protein
MSRCRPRPHREMRWGEEAGLSYRTYPNVLHLGPVMRTNLGLCFFTDFAVEDVLRTCSAMTAFPPLPIWIRGSDSGPGPARTLRFRVTPTPRRAAMDLIDFVFIRFVGTYESRRVPSGSHYVQHPVTEIVGVISAP